MTITLCFCVFLVMVAVCLMTGRAVLWAILGGLILFTLVALGKGFRPKEIGAMAWGHCRKSLLVLRILALIGVITGLWRASGTIALCVYYGIQLITPRLFLLVAFLLTSLLSYALGTSFGVVSTAGVIFMALARFGGVNELVAGGVLLSGIYFGDRCSPASSSASLVAAVSGTELYDNVRLMFRTALLPLVLTTAIYAVLSFQNPLSQVDEGMLALFADQFCLTPWALLPAVIMVVLPLLRVPILWTMAASIAASVVLAVGAQGFSLWEVLEIAVMGYAPQSGGLAEIFSGGGLVSMASPLVLLPLTGFYTGVLEGIGAMKTMEELAGRAAGKIGRLPAMAAVSALCCAVFCNQTVAIMLAEQLLGKAYGNKRELAQDIENTAVLIAGMVPWAIACSIPLSVLGVSYAAVGYGALLWLIPLCYLFTKRWFFKGDDI